MDMEVVISPDPYKTSLLDKLNFRKISETDISSKKESLIIFAE